MSSSGAKVVRRKHLPVLGDLVAGDGSGGFATITGGIDEQELRRHDTSPSGWQWITETEEGPVPDADGDTKGLVMLAGDLGGTAISPTVPGLASKADKATQVIAGTGLTGGGTLAADRTLTVSYGSTAATACQGNDSRLSDPRVPTAHTHPSGEVTGLGGAALLNVGTTAGTVAAGDDSRITGAVQSSLVDAKGDLLVATADNTVVRLPVGINGSALIASSVDTPGMYWGLPQDSLAGNALISGGSTISRVQAMSRDLVMVSGELQLTYFTPTKTETITTIAFASGSAGTTGTPTVVRVGIYSVAGNGDLTLVASTPHDASLLAAADTKYSKALSAPWSKVHGQRYAAGILQVNVGQVARLTGLQLATAMGQFVGPPRISARIAGQTNLPASILNGSLTDGSRMTYIEFIP